MQAKEKSNAGKRHRETKSIYNASFSTVQSMMIEF